MQRSLLRKVSACLATVVGVTTLGVGSFGFSQPSQAAFAGKVFGCSNPEPGLEMFPNSANALIASPANTLPGFPVHATIAVFGDVFQADGKVVTGETRCFQALEKVRAVNSPNLVGKVGITYEPISNGQTIIGAHICLVPLEASGLRNCGTSVALTNNPPAPGTSYRLFTVSESPNPVSTAADIAELLGTPSLYVNGSAVFGGRTDGRSRI